MKTLLLLITLFAFLQSAFLPVNLVLVLIAARGLVSDDRQSLYIAFFGGLILGFLMQVNLGYYPLVLILLVKIAVFIKKLPVSFNILVIFASGVLLIGIGNLLNTVFIQQEFKIPIYIVEILLFVPFYYLTRFWEERFSVKPHQKLRIK